MKQQKKIHRIYLAIDLKSDVHRCSMDLSHRILNVLRIKNNEMIFIFNDMRQECLSRVSIEDKQVVLNISKRLKVELINRRKLSCVFQ